MCTFAGELRCNPNAAPGCYCPTDTYANEQGVCVLKNECHRE